MKYCPHCGLPVHNKRAGICEECGKPLSGSARRKEQRTAESKPHEPRDLARDMLSNFESAHNRQKKMMRRFKVIAALITLAACLLIAYAVVNMTSHVKNRRTIREHATEYSVPEFSIPEFSRPEISVPEFSWPDSAFPAQDAPVIPSPGELDGESPVNPDGTSGDTSGEADALPYSVTLTGHEMTTNLFGENVLVLDLEFTNNSSTAASFFQTLTAKVTQNGSQCMQTAATVDPALTGVNTVEPGASCKVQLAFIAAPDTETQITVSTWRGQQTVMEESFTS